MTPSRIETPGGQNWSCHSCGNCCSGHMLIPLSMEEKERIEKQKWSETDGVDSSKMIVGGLNQYRLGHKADGACVFLDENKRCRIHAKFGEVAKPLACRLFPLLVFPAGRKVLVGLRFSCPSAAANQGKLLAERAGEIAGLADEVLPEDWEKLQAPAVTSTPGLDWPDFLRFVKWLSATFAMENVPVALKILRALQWLEKVERSYFDQISGDTADEILGALVHRAGEQLPSVPSQPETPSRFGRLFLRMMVLEHAQVTTVADRSVQSTQRWKLLLAALKFMSASGRTPVVRQELKRVRFSDVEKSFGPLPPGAEALLNRYFQVKIQSLQLCGKGYHDCSLIEGFRNLALIYPIIVWLARWLAVSGGRSHLIDEDVMKAVSMADHQYGFAPYVGWRTRLLQQRNDIVKLCALYAS